MSPFEICEVLGIDGLMTSNYYLTKPMSEEGAIASGILSPPRFWRTCR
jgi:hypothetical protein